MQQEPSDASPKLKTSPQERAPSKRSTTASILIATAIIAALGVILAAVLPVLLQRRGSNDDLSREDLVFVGQIRGILTENQAVNLQYYEYRASPDFARTSFGELLSTLDHLIARKTKLAEQLSTLNPSRRYAPLYQLLGASISSDSQLIRLDRESIQDMRSYLAAMESVPKIDTVNLSRDAARDTAFKVLMDFRRKNREFLDRARERMSQEKATRANSATAIRLLNKELERQNLPYTFSNVFEDIPQARRDSP